MRLWRMIRLFGASLSNSCCFIISFQPAKAQFQVQLYKLTPEETRQLTDGKERLEAELKSLKEQSRATGKPAAVLLPDVEIYLNAVSLNLYQQLFFSKQNVAQAIACLKEGEARASALKEGNSPWTRQTGTITLGYRSMVDGSAQPYQVYIPADYKFDAPKPQTAKPQRLDIFLHGRGGNLNEPSFIRSTGWVRGSFGTAMPEFLALYPYGRGNNGWRYAGETDVFEALADCKRRYHIDENQTTLRGFSMGGHGAWHIGLQHPGLWAVMSPGAGFVETKRYRSIAGPLPYWQESLLHLYDPLDYAANAKNLPLLHYVGELDPAKTQHEFMVEQLKKENAPYQEFIGPQTPHRYEPKSLQTILDKMRLYKREPDSPVHFITYTLRYPNCKWVAIEGLAHHWQRSEVDGELIKPTTKSAFDNGTMVLHTKNVTALSLHPPGYDFMWYKTVEIDGQALIIQYKTYSPSLHLLKLNGQWMLGEERALTKKPGLQGPIDDALFGPVLAVGGTGTAWNESADRWTIQELQRFRANWGRYFRGTLQETTDTKLTSEQFYDYNLYLFGDPGSNALLRRLLPKLPLRWTKDSITIKGKKFSAKDHLPMLIFPNPENPRRYVVINTGLTFSTADQDSSNGDQYPHLPDYTIIRFDADKFTDVRSLDTEFAGFFDERWR